MAQEQPQVPTRSPGAGSADAVAAMARKALLRLLAGAEAGGLYVLLSEGDGDAARHRRGTIAHQLRQLGWPVEAEYLDATPAKLLDPSLRDRFEHRHVHRIELSEWPALRSALLSGALGEEGRSLAADAGIEATSP